MNNEVENSNNIASSIRLIGSLIFIGGIIFLFKSQLMEIPIYNSENIDGKTLLELPKKIAERTNFTLLAGLLIIVGLQLSLVSNQIIKEINEQFKKPI
jgi:hypothetical protein